MTWQNYISSDPNLCHGQVCVKGTRIPVSVVLDNLGIGMSPEEVVKVYPTLTVEAVRAAILYASILVREHIVELTPNEN